MITLIHGPAELLRSEALSAIRSTISDDPSMTDLNESRLDGKSASISEIRNICDTMPFLAERRLVVVDGLLRRLASPTSARRKSQPAGEADGQQEDAEAAVTPASVKADLAALGAYLPLVPESCDLVFLEEEQVRGGAILRQLAELQRDGRAKVVACQNPRKFDLPNWIRERAQRRGVQLEGPALVDLADYVGDDLRQLDQELIKLADFSAGKRAVTRADVRMLVAATRAASVFELVDALGLGDARSAGRLLQHALDVDGEPPLRVLAMIGRQYRLLIMAKSLQAQGFKPNEVAQELNVQEWTAPRLLEQASRHSFAQLQGHLELVLATDEGIKTGRFGDREGMDLLLAGLVMK
jgi:DNA polymerase-3 subunit delta